MRYLILSDIHSNWEALESVLADAAGDYSQILCLGDLVGYGADPNAVTAWARQHVHRIVRGNHDKAVAGLLDLAWFNPAAAAAAIWTREQLQPENLEYLKRLPPGPLGVESFRLVHGSPADEDDYVLTRWEAAQLRQYLESPLYFFGHTHVQGGFLVHRNGTQVVPPLRPSQRRHIFELPEDFWCLINPGSVGQPRDGDPRAAYAIYDSEERTVEFRRVPYNVSLAQRKILEAGLPAGLAHRLALGQ